jgi:peptidoglycan/xylan/chitin deacetylase (PgdA/CDA1 family)
MGLLAAEFKVLPLREACLRLARGQLPTRAVSITFDDGYADNEQLALPVLKRFGLQATFFVTTGYTGGRIMFNDAVIETVRRASVGTHNLSTLGLGTHSIGDVASRRAAIRSLIGQLKYRPLQERSRLVEQLGDAMSATPPNRLMMDAAQIKHLCDEGMEIGAHTVNHPILKSIGEDEARSEIESSKRTLEEITGGPVTLFAYPNGKPGQDYGPEHVRLVREAGFAAAVSTVGGVAHRRSDLFQLPRFGPWDKNPLRLGARLLATCARAT